MFAVMGDLEARHSRCTESVYKGGQGSVPFAGKLNFFAVPEQTRSAAHSAVATLSLESTQAPGPGSIDVFAPEHGFEFRAADFAAQPVHFLVSNRAEFPLHFFRQLDTKFTLQQVGNAAFARLAVNANDLSVLPADVGRIDCQVRHVPMRLAFLRPFGKTFPDSVLMRPAESSED